MKQLVEVLMQRMNSNKSLWYSWMNGLEHIGVVNPITAIRVGVRITKLAEVWIGNKKKAAWKIAKQWSNSRSVCLYKTGQLIEWLLPTPVSDIEQLTPSLAGWYAPTSQANFTTGVDAAITNARGQLSLAMIKFSRCHSHISVKSGPHLK